MKRSFRVLAAVVLASLVIATVAYLWRNPERATLDDAARAEAPGRFVRLSDGMTHYDVSGPDTGRLVVLVHGFSVPFYIWDSTAVGLSETGYRVLRYDVYGRGYSDRPDVAYDSALFTRQLRELVDSLRLRGPFDLMGLSFGGFVTSAFTVAHPGQVRTLTLVDPVASPSQLPAFLGWPVVGHWFWQVMQAPGAAEGQPGDFLHPERWPDWMDRYRPQMRYRGFGRSLRRSALTSSRTAFDSLYAAVGRTRVPVLLVWGKQDSTVSIALSPVVREHIPGIEYFAVDSAGHLPHMEQAGIVRRRMIDFLTAHAASRDTSSSRPSPTP